MMIDAANLTALREMAAFENCYTIERGPPPQIRLSKGDIIMKTHEIVEQRLMNLLQTRGDHPELRQIKKNIQCGPSKYPVYFAALDVLRAAFTKLPAGSWATFSSPLCLKSHLMWKDAGTHEINMRAFASESDLNGLKATVMDEAQKIHIVN